MTTRSSLLWSNAGDLLRKLEGGSLAGVLVGEQLEGDRRFLVIDRSGGEVHGEVRALAGVRFPSGGAAVAKLADRIDPVVGEALAGDTAPRWFHAVKLVERFDPPRKLGTPVAPKIPDPDPDPSKILVGEEKNQEGPSGDLADLEKRLTLWGSPAGKVKIADRLAELLPEGDTYVEPFAGSAAVFFSTPRHKREVLGDANGNIVKALRIVQGLTDGQIAKLRELPATGDRATFLALRDAPEPSDPVAWLHRFAYVNRFSIGYKGRDFNAPHAGVAMKLLDRLEGARDRLRGVEIVGGDYAGTVAKFDGPGAVFFLDPPYGGYNVNVGERKFDEDKFLEVLEGIEGRWLLTYGVRGKVGAVLRRKGYHVARIATLRTWGNARAGDGVMQLEQVLASNAPIDEAKLRTLVGKSAELDPELELVVLLDESPEELEALALEDDEVVKREAAKALLRPLWKSPGGKTMLAPKIAALLPEHRTYVEPFAGCGAVLWAKAAAELEVVNDLDPEIAAAWAAVKGLDEASIAWLRARDWTSSKATYLRLKASTPKSAAEAFYRHAYLSRFSFAGTRAAWDARLEGQTSKMPARLEAARDRLARVKVFSKDYREILAKFDGPDTLFFLDPPYPGSYGLNRTAWETGAATGERDFDEPEFLAALKRLEGRWLLTYGEGGELPAQLRRDGYPCVKLITAARMRTMRAVADKGETLTHLVFRDKRSTPAVKADPPPEALNPAVLARLAVADLAALLRVLDGELAAEGGDRSRSEDVVNAAIFVLEELNRRQAPVPELAVVRVAREFLRAGPTAKADEQLDDALEVAGPSPAVGQLHFRGSSVHADLRLRVGDHVIGWTLAIQKPGKVGEVATVEDARRYVAELSLEGSEAFKPLLAPANLYALPKARQPVEWLEIDERVIKPGEIGATAEESGVVVAFDRFKWEPGRQETKFREYLLTSGRIMLGILYFRQIDGADGPTWIAHVGKDALPGVLDKGAVMPPAGRSWLPRTLEQATPERWRYWRESNPDKARALRDELVDARWFTAENVKIVDGEFRRVEAKSDASTAAGSIGAGSPLDKGFPPAVSCNEPTVVEATNARPDTVAEIEPMIPSAMIAKLADRPLTGAVPLLKADGAAADLRYVLGIVLEPNDGADGNPLEPDAQNDVYSANDIRAAAWEFLARYRRIGFMHERPLAEQDIEIVESYVAPAPFTLSGYNVRRGTWLLGVRVLNDELWRRIQAGDFAAWSVDGVAARRPLEGER